MLSRATRLRLASTADCAVFLPGADEAAAGAVTGTYWPYRYQAADRADAATRRRAPRYALVQPPGDMAHPRALVRAGEAVEATHLVPRLTPGQRYGETLGELSTLERAATATDDAARLLLPVPAWNPDAVDAVWENTSPGRRVSAVCWTGLHHHRPSADTVVSTLCQLRERLGPATALWIDGLPPTEPVVQTLEDAPSLIDGWLLPKTVRTAPQEYDTLLGGDLDSRGPPPAPHLAAVQVAATVSERVGGGTRPAGAAPEPQDTSR